MAEYIDVTPTWEEILPTWLHIAAQAYAGLNEPESHSHIETYEKQRVNFEAQMLFMARAADKWNAHVKEQGK